MRSEQPHIRSRPVAPLSEKQTLCRRHVWGSEFGERDCGSRSEPLPSPALHAAARRAPRTPVGGGAISVGGCGVRKDPPSGRLRSRSGEAALPGPTCPRGRPRPLAPQPPKPTRASEQPPHPRGLQAPWPLSFLPEFAWPLFQGLRSGVPSFVVCACVRVCAGASVSLCSVGSPCVQCRLGVWMVTPHEGAFYAGLLPVRLSADCTCPLCVRTCVSGVFCPCGCLSVCS